MACGEEPARLAVMEEVARPLEVDLDKEEVVWLAPVISIGLDVTPTTGGAKVVAAVGGTKDCDDEIAPSPILDVAAAGVGELEDRKVVGETLEVVDVVEVVKPVKVVEVELVRLDGATEAISVAERAEVVERAEEVEASRITEEFSSDVALLTSVVFVLSTRRPPRWDIKIERSDMATELKLSEIEPQSHHEEFDVLALSLATREGIQNNLPHCPT